jgi:hypothetical protein
MFKRFFKRNRYINRWFRISWRTKYQFYKQLGEEIKKEESEGKTPKEMRRKNRMDKIIMVLMIFVSVATIVQVISMMVKK